MKQFYFWLLLVFITWGVTGQTTLINPATEGGFENGSTFAANGWTAVNATTDGWTVGTTPVQATGANCAYVSANGGTSWTYSQLSTYTHIYKDVTVPAGENKVTLTFKWKANGEGTTTSDYDNLKIFLAPTSVTPTSSAAVTGATQLIGPGAISGMYKLNSATWNNETIVFSVVPGTTYRLIFQWKSDSSTIANPPAALDDISLVSSTPGTYTSITVGNWSAGTTWDAGSAPSVADNVIVSTGTIVTIDLSSQGAYNLDVNGILAYGTTPTSFVVNGNLTVNSVGLINVFFTSTGKQLNVAGNIVNDGRIDLSVSSSTNATTQGNLTLNGANVQTVSGSGTFGGTVTATDATNSVGVIRHLVFANTNTTLPNINWQINNVRLMNGIVVNANNRVNLNGNKIYFGNFTSFSSGTVTVNNSNSGFYNGSISRWWTTGQTGTGITAGTDPTNSTSRFPFITSTGQNRALYISRSASTTAGNTAGYTTVTYNDVTGITTGLNVVDGTYTITDRANGNWAISTENGYVYASGTHTLVGFYNYGLIVSNNTAARLMNANAVVGTFQNGSITPAAQRTGISTAQLIAEPFYIGTNTADIPFISIANGDWNVNTTWNKGSVPTCTDSVVIASGHTVTVNSAGNFAKNVTVNSGGGLTVLSGELTIGCGANNFFLVNNGFVHVQGGNLNINGYFSIPSTSAAFTQEGGTITIDGNAAGVATNSVTSSFALFHSLSTNISLTGGTLLFVDPHAVSGGYTVTFNNSTPNPLTLATAASHLTKFGDGSSTDAGGGVQGFYIDTWTGSALLSLGSIEVNGGSGTNRAVTSRYNFLANGDVTVNIGSTMTLGVPLVLGGNLLINGTYVNTAGGVVATRVSANTGSAMTFTPSIIAQSITNNGTVGNLAASPTANLFALNVNNTSASGLTLNSPISVSGTLTLTSGIINTTNTNLLTLGTATAAGTLSGGSDTAYVKGPFARTIASTNSSYIQYPVGKATYAPIWLAPATTAVSVMKAETFDSNSGTVDASITSLSSTRRWEAPLTSGTITNVNVRLGDAAIASNHIPVQAPTASGTYTNAFGSVATYAAGTPNTTQSNTAVEAANYTGFISYAVSNVCSGAPNPGNTIASSNSICLGESVSFSLQNITSGTGVTYQWKSSTDGSNYSDILSATNSTYAETPQAATYYKCAVTCTNSSTTTESTPIQIMFTNSVASTTPGTRCGTGTVGLGATTSSGTLNWYAAATGGTSLGTGTTFNTPSINATTDFYVGSLSSMGGNVTVGSGSLLTGATSQPSAFVNRWPSYRIQTLYTAAELSALGLFAGDITSISYFTTTLGDGATNANFTVKIGTTSQTSMTTTWVPTTGFATVYGPVTHSHTASGEQPIIFSTPYTWDGVSNIVIEVMYNGADISNNAITYYSTTTSNMVVHSGSSGSSVATGTATTTRLNLKFAGQVSCSSPRVAVTATVTPPPALTLNTTSETICEGESTPLITITSGASDYDTYAWTPTTGVSGDAASGWTFNPTATTTYTLNASHSVSGCSTSIVGIVTVNPLPSALVFTPTAPEVCVDGIVGVNVTGGSMPGSVIFDENFNGVTNTWTTVNSSTGTNAANAAWTLRNSGYVYDTYGSFVSNDNTQFYLSNSDSAGSGSVTNTALVSPSFSTVGFESASVSFWHYFRSAGTAKVQYSIDGGTVWTDIQSFTSTQGAIGAFVLANVTIPSLALNQADVKLRFKYDASWQYFWAIDNVVLSGSEFKPVVWSPQSNLYTDAAATNPLTASQNARTVYFKSNTVGPVNYTATAINNPTGCDRDNNVTITVLPNTTLAYTSGNITQSVCVDAAITDIVYTVANGTGASASGLPAGVIGTYSSGTYTLSGTPTAVGTFNYTVWGTGTCEPSVALTGTIVVNPNTTLALTSGETNQTIYNGSSITDIVYTVTNGTSANVTGLPSGVNGTFNAGVFTISGLPTQVGIFNYSVTGIGTCASSAALTGTITVNSCDIGWANLQWPGSGTINTCGTYDVYAQVWMSGVTGAAGAGDGITAWMGISTSNTDPSTWTDASWFPATFNVQSGNNDEFKYTFSNLTAGNYFIASRFKYTCGSYYYGAYNAAGGGAWDGTNNVNATLTVNAIAPPTGDATQTFCNAGTVADLIAVGDNLKWYDAATLGNELTLSTALVNGTHYFASQTVAGCESTTRLDVAAVVNITAAPMSVAAKWTFEPVQGTNANPTPNIGTGTSALVGSMTGAGTATGMNTATGCGTQTTGTFAWAIGTANPGTINESSGAQWNVSTVGLSNVKLAWEQRFSNTATNTLRLQYSTDGSTWNNFEMTESNTSYCLGTLNNGRFETDITGDSYRRINVDLSAITDANNNPNFGWRVVAAHYQNTGEFRRVTVPTTISTGGTWRFDNVTLSGSSTQTFCEGATVANLVATGTALKWYAEASGGTELVATEVLTAGTYYASQTLDACESQTRLAVQVVINPNTTIALTSGDVNQTVLNGIDITDIVYTITNGTGATVTGLPNGVIATYLAGTLTISGAPTENGTFNYSIYGTGTCASSSVLTGTITVNDCVIGWANLQWPGTGTINTCNPYGVYAQIWIDGVTNATGAGDNITAWIGLSTANTDPSTWTETIWYPASFNAQAGNNDEFWYEFDNLPAGTYYIASRFKYACSPYYYGGFQSGAWNGTSNVNAQLTVNAIAMPTGNTTQYMCSTSPFTTLNDLNVVAGGTLIWYDAAIGGNVLPSTTTMIVGTTYYAANQQDGCESARLAVLVQEDCSLAIDPETEMIRMYPNPTADFLNLVSETGIKEVEVFNQLGQKVQVTLLTPDKLDVRQLAIGTYVIRLTLMNGNISTDIFIKK